MKKAVWFVCLFAALALALSGCGSKEVKSAEKTVENAFASLKKADFDALAAYASDAELFGGDTMGLVDDVDALGDAMYGRVGYEIKSAELKDDGSVVMNVAVTNADMAKAIDAWLGEMSALVVSDEGRAMEQDELMAKSSEMLISAMKAAEDTVTTEVEITVKQNEDGGRLIETDNALIDAAAGGLVTALKSKVG